MRQEDKELLLKDLCGRLPYGVKVKVLIEEVEYDAVVHGVYADETVFVEQSPEPNKVHLIDVSHVSEVKPYLFSLSSITKEHRKKISEILKDININHPPYGLINPNGCDALLTTVTMQGAALIEFYNKYHYDYNGLIPKGLAKDATGLNIYKEV